jgi:NTP pyrophosphatase (non-canonical NTP hydrolase)
MRIRDCQKAVHALAIDRGWWPDGLLPEHISTDSVLAKLALIHSEVSEAVEEARITSSGELNLVKYFCGKPEGFAIELADAAIRIFDLADALGIDLQSRIEEKHGYNATRERRHGGKLA